ncbi:MAG: AAA family ATPase [Candidatus Njordarchaeales archaeon]
MGYAPMWKNPLPSITGQDALELSKHIDLPFWRMIRSQYDEFIESALASNEVKLLAIIGEWGVGKTASYKAFLEPLVKEKEGFSIILKTSDVMAFFEKLAEAPLFSAERTLKALLLTICKKLRIRVPRHIRTEKLLSTILHKTKKRFLVVFLDEFESILGMSSKITFTFIDGLVGLVNGEFQPLSKKGDLRGTLHIILSLTPQAKAKFLSDSSLVETIGRHLRRVQAIEMRPLNREETYLFLIGCLEYLYAGSLPDVLPIPTISVFDAYYLATRGYPGYLVAVLNNLLSNLLSKRKNNSIPVASSEDLLISMKGIMLEEIGEIKIDLISDGSLSFYINLVTEGSSEKEKEWLEKTLKALVVLAVPATLEEISSLTSLPLNICKSCIEVIEEKFSNMIQNPILRFKAIELKDFFKEFLKEVFEQAIDDWKDVVEEILKKLTKFTLDNKLLRKKLLVPADDLTRRVLENYLASIYPQHKILIKQVLDILRQKTEPSEEILYSLNPCILNDIYPPPCPICDLIDDKNLALTIWRETLRQVTGGDYDFFELGKAMLPLIMEEFLLNEADYLLDKFVVKKIWRYGNRDIPLRFIPVAILLRGHVIEALKILEREGLLEKIPIVMLFVKEDLYDYAKKIVEKADMNNLIVVLPLHTVDIAIMYGIRKIVQKCASNIHKEIMFEILNRVRRRYDHNPRKIFEEKIIQEGLRRGLIILQPPWSKSPSLSALPSVYDYYLVYPKQLMKTHEVFEWVTQHVKSQFFYGWKRRDLLCGADIESKDKLKELENYLIESKFLERVGEFVQVRNSPAEELILQILSRKSCSLRSVKEFFIIERGAETLLETIFLSTLERKGLIRYVKKGDEVYIEKISLGELLESFNKKLRNIEKQIEHRDPIWRTFSIFIVAKEREYRVISIDKLLELAIYLRNSAVNVLDEMNKARQLSAALRLLGIAEEYIKLANIAYRRSSELIDKISVKMRHVRELLKNISRDLRGIGLRVIEPFQEEILLENLLIEAKEAFEKRISVEEARKLVEEYSRTKDISIKDLFDFRYYKIGDEKILEKAYFFNPKYLKIMEIYNRFEEIVKGIERDRREIQRVIYSLLSGVKRLRSDIEGSIKSILKTLRAPSYTNFTLYVSSPQFGQEIDELGKALQAIRAIEKIAEATREKLYNIKDALTFVEKLAQKTKTMSTSIDSLSDQYARENIGDEYRLLENYYQAMMKLLQEFVETITSSPELTSLENFFSNNLQALKDLAKKVTFLIDKLEKEKNDRRRKCGKYIQSIHEWLEKVPIQDLSNEDIRTFESLKHRFRDLKTLVENEKNLIKAEKELEEIFHQLKDLLTKYADPITLELIRILSERRKREYYLEEIAKKMLGDDYSEEDLRNLVSKLLRLRDKMRIRIIIKCD